MTNRKPRDIRSAVRRGWKVIQVSDLGAKGVSYVGLQIWTDCNAKGKFVSKFMPTKFAFENDSDAAWFALKWM